MKILILGANGQVGWDLRSTLAPLGEVVAASRDRIDLADLEGLRSSVVDIDADIVVNAAAYNDVDGAESDEGGAFRVNAEAVRVLGEAAGARPAALVTYSTDFVFDGEKSEPYTEDDPPHPLGAYARSKRAGEEALMELEAPALVLRTAWVYSLRRKSFVSTMHRLARERAELRVAADQMGSPTWCGHLARATADLIRALGTDPAGAAAGARGVYHLAGSGAASRYELVEAMLALDPKASEHEVERLVRGSLDDFPAPAPRPRYSVLDCSRIDRRFGVRLPPWKDGLREALASPG